MLPAGPPPFTGWSSLSMMASAAAMRDWLLARTISELLRGSTITEAALLWPGTPGTEEFEASSSFCTVCTTSEATAFFSCTTCISPPAGWSSAVMILPRRCRLSA
ncbi:MAG: hypothetical protein JF585_01530 [Burkholderiales bacterium]|nr:hypothetical protein [Burkholderiales bacterium]